MDNVRGFDDEDRTETGYHDDSGDSADSPQIEIGGDERRMHVRAYNHWVSLLRGRAYPLIEDLDPDNISDFGPHSVLLDFSRGIENPAIAFLGRALREECALEAGVTHIADVPARSLLSRLTDHYLQIIANRAPIGFEAEFVSTRGHNTMYRGILMPFSSDDDSIDFIYGVINWKELVDAETQARLNAELDAAVRTTPKPTAAAPVWADGPSAGFDMPAPEDDAAVAEIDDEPVPAPSAAITSLPDRLMLAQQTAAAVRAADTRTRATLYRALERAHDFAAAADNDPAGYEALLDQAGIAVQLRAPMTPVVKLVFGADYDKTRLTEYAAVLAHARRHGVPAGGLGQFLEQAEGGIKGVVKAERAARAPAASRQPDVATRFESCPALATVTLDTHSAAGDFVVLLARAGDAGTLDIVAALDGDSALTQRVMRHAAM
ncbi:MAG: hypothetical protein WC804_05160 [Sphingomonas sp.]|jgi:hypothetical protein|uniref:PAS domain-containing protein n=1 Tax=Sphingomonas sp. TaxID=28214 RepID=UPI0035629D02